ncbi:DHS-like NAD/FAD-binding domain-containing protein [Mycena rosella]|uniref:DHS-like NAD/FAD-binding domain-containing protein n=1 Tax=Mycena rosella TaxID=1033263 RepID=A0AAD7DYU7_MYCRO|nr:DHS-like NAD/FAD-binding domain-containing protein [Mycena rosella]
MAKNKILKAQDIPGLAEYIASDKCKNIVLMLGAGVSTSAGIPDFRSPETGLYANLARLKLPYPEAVFEINFFRKNPEPFYTLAHELYPGKFRPTITHSFIRLLAAHSLLHTCFTQNIDTLERRAGVPGDKIIEAHGSFASQRCIDCHRAYDDDKMKRQILAKETPKCETCGGLVKPDIVFFGENLPDEFITAIPNVAKADLLIIMGTSMTVHPFAGLAERASSNCPRVLINLDLVGSIGKRPNDVVLLGKCDDVVRKLCKELGWEDELLALWAKTEAKAAWDDTWTEPEAEDEDEDVAKAEAAAGDLVGVITEAIGRQLNLDEAAGFKEDSKETPRPTAVSSAGNKDDGDTAKQKEDGDTAKQSPPPAKGLSAELDKIGKL